jgi:hypothetical protein
VIREATDFLSFFSIGSGRGLWDDALMFFSADFPDLVAGIVCRGACTISAADADVRGAATCDSVVVRGRKQPSGTVIETEAIGGTTTG